MEMCFQLELSAFNQLILDSIFCFSIDYISLTIASSVCMYKEYEEAAF